MTATRSARADRHYEVYEGSHWVSGPHATEAKAAADVRARTNAASQDLTIWEITNGRRKRVAVAEPGRWPRSVRRGYS